MPYYPKKRNLRKKKAKKSVRRKGRKTQRGYAVNTASIRENYQLSADDGTINLLRNMNLADPKYDRSQAVAQAYQEYRMKYVRLTFRPSADTFAPAAGNSIPNLYYVLDRTAIVPTNANLQTLLDMGVRPIRFDDKNITKKYKPAVLLLADSSGIPLAPNAMPKTTPWLSTNANAGSSPAAWVPSNAAHNGCAFFVTKMSGATPTLEFTIDVEVVFEFRKPLWRTGAGVTEHSEPTPVVFL